MVNIEEFKLAHKDELLQHTFGHQFGIWVKFEYELEYHKKLLDKRISSYNKIERIAYFFSSAVQDCPPHSRESWTQTNAAKRRQVRGNCAPTGGAVF